MTAKIKKQISGTMLLCLIALVASVGISLTACNKEPQEKKVSGTVTADASGTVQFMYSRLNSNVPNACTFTTNLPSPNDLFVLTIASGNTSETKAIGGLTAGQKIEWTAKVEGNPLNHGSGNFVHIVND
jgi:hypothetical protein